MLNPKLSFKNNLIIVLLSNSQALTVFRNNVNKLLVIGIIGDVCLFFGVLPERSKIVVVEQVSSFNVLGCNISYLGEDGVWNKRERFSRTNGTLSSVP